MAYNFSATARGIFEEGLSTLVGCSIDVVTHNDDYPTFHGTLLGFEHGCIAVDDSDTVRVIPLTSVIYFAVSGL